LVKNSVKYYLLDEKLFWNEMDTYFNNLTKIINKSLINPLSPEKGILEEALYYVLSVKGKRLRPLIYLCTIEAFGGQVTPYLDIACGLEYIHTYSLIHDDLPAMDNDDFRRGMPTLHKKYNDAIAILAGDALLTLAFERIAEASLAPLQIVNMIRLITQSIGKDGMAGGQILDLTFNGDKTTIELIHQQKTAAFIRVCFLCAAESLNLSADVRDKLAILGGTLGIAFQMADDLLDTMGDEQTVGKKIHKDFGNNSPNSVLFFGENAIRSKIDSAFSTVMGLTDQLQIQFAPFQKLMQMMLYRQK
jgi:geranylgeranyl diphosphate synthase type II